MNLDQMIDICLDQTGNDSDSKSEYYTRFKNSINYAKNKIAKEKVAPDRFETITITDETFLTTTLTRPFLKIKGITDLNGYTLRWDRISSTQIKVPNQRTSVIVLYEYLPSDLSNATDELDFPPNVVDPQILCYFASYQYFLAEGGATDLGKSSYWLNLWNDGFNSIRKSIGEVVRIKDVYGVGR